MIHYAIGDIHGCYDHLMALMKKIKDDFDKSGESSAKVVFVGDYVDRGPKSRHVLDYLMNGSPFENIEFICIKGNHEDMFVNDYKINRKVEAMYDKHVLRSFNDEIPYYETIRDLVHPKYIDWMDNLPLSYETDTHFFCHAGINPGIPLSQQSATDLIWIRNLFLSYRYEFEKIIVHGHTPTVLGEPEIMFNRINCDSHCYNSGRLTCVKLFDNNDPIVIQAETWEL